MVNKNSNTDSDSTRIAILIIATIGSFLTPFISSAINIAIPAIGAEFASNAILLNWIPTSFLLTGAMFAVPFGRIADIYGIKKIFNYGVVTFTVMSFLCVLAPSILLLLVFRILQGIGGAMVFVTGLALITSAFPKNMRGRAIGVNLASVYSGLSLGPVLGGIMTQYLGWRSLFYVMVPLGVLIICLSIWKLKGDWAVCKGEKFDFKGSVIYSVGLVLLMYGVSTVSSSLGIIMIILGILTLLGFIICELHVKSPVLNVKLFKNQVFAFSNLAALINYSATFAIAYLLSLYLQYIKGFPAHYAGFILVVQPVIMAVLSPVAGRLSERIEAQFIASLGMAFCTVGLALFTFIDASTSLNFIMVGLLIVGIGFGLFSSPNTSAIMGSVEKRFYGVASATVSTMRLVGQMMSMGIALLVFSVFVGPVQITPDQYPGLLKSIHTVFIICTILCFAGIFASLARGKNHDSMNVT